MFDREPNSIDGSVNADILVELQFVIFHGFRSDIQTFRYFLVA